MYETDNRHSHPDVRFVFFLHKRLIKPKELVKLHCPACGRQFIKVNSDTIEVHNSFGLPDDEIKTSDSWQRVRCHSCKAQISILWK